MFISQRPLQHDLIHPLSAQVSYFWLKKKKGCCHSENQKLDWKRIKIFWIASCDLEEQTGFIMSFESFKTDSLIKGQALKICRVITHLVK